MEQIEKEYSINLCELVKHIGAWNLSIDGIIKTAEKKEELGCISRIYFGSYFCSHYFLHLTKEDYELVIGYAKEHNIKLTMVLPITTEKNLDLMKDRLNELKKFFTTIIDEVTVNDYGMLAYISNNFDVKINLGRLFMKDYRDPRYPDYFNRTFQPRVFTAYMRHVVNQYHINVMEFDPTHKALDFAEKPEEVLIGLHTPYCYMTTGQICEYSSLNKDISKKFRPNMDCSIECLSHHIEYDMDDLEPERKFIRFGRTVYFENRNCKVENLNKMRVIYFPLDAH